MAGKKFDNVQINVEFSEEQELKELNSGEGLSVLMGKLAKAVKSTISHLANNVKHITADERTAWNGKADKSEIPTSLPAGGGNADTVGHYTPQQLIQSNPNLLDNPDFKINQRGKDVYSADNYTVDRWCNRRASGHTTVTVENDGIRLTDSHVTGTLAALNQRIEKPEDLLGKTVTISCLITENESDCATLVGFYLANTAAQNTSNFGHMNLPAGATGYFTVTITLPSTMGDFSGMNFSIRSWLGSVWNVKVAWVKVEYGNASTPFVPPDPALELLKCQRFYQNINGTYSAPIISNQHGAIWSINLPVEMRISPTIIFPTIDDDYQVGKQTTNQYITGGWSFGSASVAYTPNLVQIQLNNSDNAQHINAYVLFASQAPIGLSADL